MLDKDTSKGVLIFINDGQNNENIIETIKSALELENTTYLKRLNACDVYLINQKNYITYRTKRQITGILLDVNNLVYI